MNFYSKYVKRVLDIVISLLFLILFWWIYIILYFLVKAKLGSPVLFCQPRPGYKERIFNMYKFRSMTNEKDINGNLLPDDKRLTSFGSFLRSSSLDELPEIFCILKGEMSFVGPRPQLVRDIVFMSDEQRKRADVRPGLTGLAQISGRNNIFWDDKLNYDLEYIKDVSFVNDIKIFFATFAKVFNKNDINTDGCATAYDYGDELLMNHKITKEFYDKKQQEAKELLERFYGNDKI